MDRKMIIKTISEIRPGRFFRVRYVHQVKLKKEFRELGVSSLKIFDVNARTGIKYCPAISNKDVQNNHPSKNWILKNKLYINPTTSKTLFVIHPVKNKKLCNVSYIFINEDGNPSVISETEAKQYMLTSECNSRETSYMTLNVDNILNIK